jgi:putative heme degradation protein
MIPAKWLQGVGWVPTEEIRTLRAQAARARDLSKMLQHSDAAAIFARIADDLYLEVDRLTQEAQFNPLTALAEGMRPRY